MIRSIIYVLFCLLFFAAAPASQANVRMPLIFGDHMVLQQNATLPIWGWADPEEKITVTFAGQMKSTTAADDGSWRIDLLPVAQSAQGQVLAVSGRNTLTFQDVLVGDVWVASGQSNMEFGIHQDRYAADVAKAADPQLRLFFVPKVTALKPADDFHVDPASEGASYSAKWLVCTPENLNKINGQGFATVAYYFARDIRQARGGPLGMVECSWGGTRAEAWTSLSGLEKDAVLAHYVDQQKRNVVQFPQLAPTYPQKKAEFDAAVKLWNTEVGDALGKAENDWRIAVQQAQAAGQPIPPKPQPSRPRPSDPQVPDGGNNGPANLFNGMVAPLIPFAIKGVIWYQGEFNSGYDSGREYATLFPRMITDWREKWAQGDFPFIFVQLPNYGPLPSQPSEEGDGWCWVREGQLKALSLPNTAMAITIDVGDPTLLHPPDKLDVGHRLALAARHTAYGENIVSSGPLYDSMTIEGNKIRLTFKSTGEGLTLGTSPYISGGKTPPMPTVLTGFGIAGDDQKFVWAQAAIEGNTVVVSSDKVPVPVAVRYDFSDSPTGDLYNKNGLPASPFRTDDWAH